MMEYISPDLMNEILVPQNLLGRICVIPHHMIFINSDSSRNTRFHTVSTKIILNTKKIHYLIILVTGEIIRDSLIKNSEETSPAARG